MLYQTVLDWKPSPLCGISVSRKRRQRQPVATFHLCEAARWKSPWKHKTAELTKLSPRWHLHTLASGTIDQSGGQNVLFFCAAQVRKWRLCRRRGEYGDGVWWPLHLLFLINSNQSTVLAFSRLWNTWHVYKLETCRPTFFFFLNSFFNFRVNVTRWMMKTIESAADRLFIDCVHCRHL